MARQPQHRPTLGQQWKQLLLSPEHLKVKLFVVGGLILVIAPALALYVLSVLLGAAWSVLQPLLGTIVFFAIVVWGFRITLRGGSFKKKKGDH